jgi:hypothetical protein
MTLSANRKHTLCKTLLNGNAVTWDINTFVDLLGVVRGNLQHGKEAVQLIDPTLLALVVDTNGNNLVKNIAMMKELTATSGLILMPIYQGHHWSLLAYIPEWKQWYFYDSLRGHHSDYRDKVLHRMDHLAIIPKEGHRIHFYDNLPEQEGATTSGSHCLFYSFLLMRWYGCVADEEDFMDKHNEDIAHELQHGSVEGFVRKLRQMLS